MTHLEESYLASIGGRAELSCWSLVEISNICKDQKWGNSAQIKHLVELIMFFIKKQRYLLNDILFLLFSAKRIAKQQEPFENVSAKASKNFR